MAATIKDVAKIAKVSVSTVSRVINNECNVKPETFRLVQDAIKNAIMCQTILQEGLKVVHQRQ